MSTNIYSENFVTPPAILGFYALAEPSGMPGEPEEKMKYGVELIFTPELQQHPDMVKIKQALDFVLGKTGWNMATLPKKPVRRTAEVESLSTCEFPEGTIFIRCKTKNQPAMFDQFADPTTRKPLPAQPSKFYSGCRVRAVTQAFSYDVGGKGITFGLTSVQFLGDGTKLQLGGGDGSDLLATDTPVAQTADLPTGQSAPPAAGGNGWSW